MTADPKEANAEIATKRCIDCWHCILLPHDFCELIECDVDGSDHQYFQQACKNFKPRKEAPMSQGYIHALARKKGRNMNYQKDNLLDVVSKEPIFDSRDFLLEALSNLNEARKDAKL